MKKLLEFIFQFSPESYVALVVYIWFFENIRNPSLVGLIFLDSILISGVTALTNLFVLQKLKEILEVGIKD